MNLKDLRYLVAVGDTQHFGHASERCFVSQPTLSGQIKKLEEELGITVFERSKRSVETTPIGKLIVAQAKKVLEEAEGLQELASSNQDPLAGPLRLGVIPTLSPYLMPLVLKPLITQYPQMKLVLSEELTDTLLVRLEQHEIDAALVATPVDGRGFDTIPLFDEPFYLVYPPGHPLSQKANISQADLDDIKLLLLSEGHCLAEQAMAVCHLHKRNTTGELSDLRAASLETLLQLVEVGFGSTLIPALALKTATARSKGLEIRPLTLPDTHRRISLVYRHTFPRQQVLQAFVEVVLNNLPPSVHPLVTN